MATKIYLALHYGCAIAAICFVFGTILTRAGMNKRDNNTIQHSLRISRIWWALVLSTYAAELLVVILRQDQNKEAHVYHVILLFCIWTFAWIRQVGAAQLIWGTALITLVFEIPLLVLSNFRGLNSALPILQISLQAIRILAFLLLVIESARARLRRAHLKEDAEETQPFLQNESDQSESQTTGYGTLPDGHHASSDSDSDTADVGNDTSDSEDEDDDASIKRQRSKRLKQAGGWWGYLKDFSIFIPFLIPKKDRKVQFCLLVSLFCIAGNRVLNIVIPRQIGIVTDQLLEEKKLPIQALAIWLLLSVIGYEGALGLIEGLAKIPIQQFSYRQVTNAAFNHVLSLPMEFHSERDSAEVMKAIEQGEALTNFLDTVAIEILPTIIDLFVAFGLLYYKFNGYVALVMVVATACFVSLQIVTSSWNIPNRRISAKAERKVSRVMHQAVQGWQTVTYFNMFGFERRRFADTVETRLTASRAWGYRDAYTQVLLDLLVHITFFTLASFALYEISLGQATPGDFVFLISYWEYLIWPMKYLSHNYRSMMSDLVDAERLLYLFQTKSSIVEKEGAQDLKLVDGCVAFEDVSFSYDGKKTTISDLSLMAAPGQTVALVGETGAGKSSIMKLLLRFYDVTGGRIAIDGQDIRDITLSSLRNALGVVPQDPLLFNASILENLRYARPTATDTEIYEACRSAAIHDKILSFPDAYETQVGEQGVKLSGGEVQRLAIARVFLKDPPILILDEATSAVDTNTESIIQGALNTLKKDRTTFIIAHRLSTIVTADQIVVVHDGRIVEQGTHSELLLRGGRYSHLWRKQVGDERDEESST